MKVEFKLFLMHLFIVIVLDVLLWILSVVSVLDLLLWILSVVPTHSLLACKAKARHEENATSEKGLDAQTINATTASRKVAPPFQLATNLFDSLSGCPHSPPTPISRLS